MCGILGLDAFRNLVVEFDFTAEKIFLHKTTATLPLFEKDRYIRQKSTRGMYALDATLGTEHVSLNIDTGFTGGLHLKQDVFDRLSTKGIIAPAKPTFSTHAFGTTQLRSGVFVSGELCGVPLQGVSVEPHETEGSVGLGFLRRLHLAFDFPSSRLYYSRVPNYAGVLDLQSMLGAKFSFENGQAYIAGLAKQGVIPQLGVKGWENLTQFGETAGPITLRSIYRTCEAMAGKEVPIKIERERRVIYSGTVRLGEKQYE